MERGRRSVDIGDILDRVTVPDVLHQLGDNRVLGSIRGDGEQRRCLSPFREEKKPSFFFKENVWYDHGGMPYDPDRNKPYIGNAIGLFMALTRQGLQDALREMNDIFCGGRIGDLPPVVRPEPKISEPGTLGDEEWEPRMIRQEKLNPFHQFLDKYGIYPETAIEAGAGVCFDEKDPMHGYLVWEVRDPVRRHLHGYTGRAVDDWRYLQHRVDKGLKKTKYLYNYENLYRSALVSELIRRYGIIVVEGAADAEKLKQEGFPHVVALYGCQMSQEQANFLRNWKVNVHPEMRITLFFDRDRQSNPQVNHLVEEARRLLESPCEADGRYYAAAKDIREVDYSTVPAGTYDNEQDDPACFTMEWLEVMLEMPSIYSYSYDGLVEELRPRVRREVPRWL